MSKGDQLLAHRPGDEQPVPARIVWASPMQAPRGGLSVMQAGKKKELAFVTDLDSLDSDSKALATSELAKRYFLPKIRRVLETRASFGNRYWHVETDRGPIRFLMKSPATNSTWLTEDRCILRDALGNCYEIESMSALDSKSRANAEGVL